ncbi:MAG TPA: pitrilysin family protein [bacterium]|nr:pitrilysin family protein [bacterium]
MTTVVLEMPGLHQVQLTLFVPVGSRHEAPGDCGSSHFVEHILFRGNALYPDGDALNRAFEGVGGMLNAHTGVEATEYEVTLHPAHLDEALRLMAAFVRAPTFGELEKERRILLDELSYDYNEEGALVNVGTLSSQLMWPNHPLGLSVGGVPETIAALDEVHLRAHHARYYRPEGMVLALAGAVQADAALRSVERHFGDWRPAPAGLATAALAAPSPRGGGPFVKTVHDADNQLHLQLSFPAPGYNDADELAMALLARTLDDGPTSRLQREIREERALVYHIVAAHSGYWDTGAFDVATSVKPELFGELLDELLGVLADVRTHGPTADEVERARLRYLFELEFDRDSPAAGVGRYAWPLLYATVRDEDSERAQIEALSRGQLAALAARLFTADRVHAVLVGPVDADVERRLRDALAAF